VLIVNTPLRQLLASALSSATLTLRQLALEAGVSIYAARLYKRQERTPGAPVIRRIAKVLRIRAQRLARLAEQLERAAAGNP
jgi:transcriptional regulator with XRE-family HTH domain